MRPRIQWPIVGVLIVSLGWATSYVVLTSLNPLDEPEALYMIKPLLGMLWLIAPFVLWSAIGAIPERLQPDPGTPIATRSRVILLVSLPLYFLLIVLIGLPAASALFVFASAMLYGERNPAVLAVLPLLTLGIIIFGFAGTLNVRIPLYPFWWP